MQILQNKQTELETSLDSLGREKRQFEADRSNVYDELQKILDDVKQKQQDIDDLHKNLGDSNSGTKELTDKIKELTEQKVKLEARGKTLDEDSKDKKTAYDSEVQKGIDLERIKTGLEDSIKDATYKLQTMAKDKGTLDQKREEAENKLKDLEKDLKKSTRSTIRFK